MISKTERYRIFFTPIHGYFFGGERSFTSGEDTYFSKSNYFPQQTTLLGAIRYYLLQNEGVLSGRKIINDTRAKALIGEGSYKLGTPWPNDGLGIVRSVSAVLMHYNNELYRVGALIPECELSVDDSQANSFWGNNRSDQFNRVLREYSPKSDRVASMVSENGSIIPFSKIFHESERVGITKGINGAPNDDAFYRQVYIHLERGWSFTVDLSINSIYQYVDNSGEHHSTVLLKNAVIPVGADRSVFAIAVKKLEEQRDYTAQFKCALPPNYPSLLLISNGVLPMEDFNDTLFISGEVTTLRQIISPTGSHVEYHRLPGMGRSDIVAPEKSGLSYVLQSGTRIFFRRTEELQTFAIKLLSSDVYNIGFNHFLITKNTDLL